MNAPTDHSLKSELQLFRLVQTKFNKRKQMKTTVMIALTGTLLSALFVAWSFKTSPERAAYDTAKTVIDKKYQTRVLSMYGRGSPKEVDTWYVNFFDPNSGCKSKVVVLTGGKINRVYASESRKQCDDNMSFDPTLNKASLEKAFESAKNYADKNQIVYDATRVSLYRPEVGKAPAWGVELRKAGVSRGVVHTKMEDGSFANYEAPRVSQKSGAEAFAKDVENTFKGIGADLEEFFTGERTVDR